MKDALKRSVVSAITLVITFANGLATAGITVNVTASSNLGNSSTSGTLDLMTGQFTRISTMSVTVTGLTSSPNGTLYASANDGFLYTVNGAGVASQFGTASAPVPAGGGQLGEFGLAYGGASGFYAENINGAAFAVSSPMLDRFSTNGNSVTTLGVLSPGLTSFGSGTLADGPNGTLYFVAIDLSGAAALFSMNTTTGAATEIGSGLGTLFNSLTTLVVAGGQLYGIDTITSSGSGPIDIYTINTTTGVATATGASVTGLAAGFTLDTAAVVPEPSSLALCVVAGAMGLAGARLRRERAAG